MNTDFRRWVHSWFLDLRIDVSVYSLMLLVANYCLDHWGVLQPHVESQTQPVDARSQPDSPVVAVRQHQRLWCLAGFTGSQISGRLLRKVRKPFHMLSAIFWDVKLWRYPAPPSTQAELHPHSELSLRGGSVSDVRLQSQQILRGSHPGPLAVRTLLRFGDESESALHPGGVAHKPARCFRHAQPGVLCLRHPDRNGERFKKWASILMICVKWVQYNCLINRGLANKLVLYLNKTRLSAGCEFKFIVI